MACIEDERERVGSAIVGCRDWLGVKDWNQRDRGPIAQLAANEAGYRSGLSASRGNRRRGPSGDETHRQASGGTGKNRNQHQHHHVFEPRFFSGYAHHSASTEMEDHPF
jgi:hypothetical protein